MATRELKNAIPTVAADWPRWGWRSSIRSEEHTSELQSLTHLVCRLLLEKKNDKIMPNPTTTKREDMLSRHGADDGWRELRQTAPGQDARQHRAVAHEAPRQGFGLTAGCP